ncbi:RagB/SusD family nutrient uptake outer membrane protein [Chitinophaga filiformis]|uniref:RagB/SusD family nutrient uptake outer membrane protein n=1 Tax=Chitinophaga filiformis TaxID=104663 RepID=A0ABY4I5B3_CHIFI|nr:RagB/SusD family nutrient uptake outer membrane protein [Chitinophaga filiformis]UPK70569.1 RagB/SusD family nutrient uptake outer membrane protein [Chitinophaga filiformis]
MKKLLFLALSCSLWACKDDDKVTPEPQQPSQKPTASITVWDATQWSPEQPKGTPADGATVELFTSREDYLMKKPAFTATTNGSGVVSFKDIPEGVYFMVATKEGKTNTWRDAQNMTRVSDTLFQSEAEIKDPTQPIQNNVLPGDFKYRDLNGDGMINNDDVAEAPFFTITVKKDSVNTARALIGRTVNHAYPTLSAVEEAFSNEYPKISAAHQQMVMVDGVLSDDADCQIANLPAGFCELDQFTFTPANSIIESAWKNHYASILQLNRMLASLNGIQGDKAAIIAQLKAFRAFLYLELQTYFGTLPMTEQLLLPVGISPGSIYLTRYNIKKDLTDALPGLPDAAPAGKPWYMTSAGANMLLARIALFEINGNDATTYTDKVIATKRYALADSAKVFTAPASNEIIWDITASMNTPFKDYFVRGGLTVNFCPAIRYTETYLLRAMGKILLEDLSGANEAINIVRTRGKKPAITLKTLDETRNELKILYKEELYREGFRYARLVLYNDAKTVLGSKGYQDKHALLPIPQSVLEAYPNIHQNVGY